nr:hypothetical protein BaRGS_022238 [Batillaria attramentaria]
MEDFGRSLTSGHLDITTERPQGTSELDVTTLTSDPPAYKNGIVSHAEYFRITKVTSWCVLVLEPLAIVLELLSMLVFLQDLQSPSNAYMAAICVAEAWYMLVIFIHNLSKLQPEWGGHLTYVQYSIWVVSYTGMLSRRAVYVLNMLVSLQRFVAIAFPLKALSVRLLRRPVVPLVSVFIMSALLHLYRPLRYTPVTVQDSHGESWTQGFSDLYRATPAPFDVMDDLSKYVTIYIPMLTCLVVNILLIASLVRHKRLLANLNTAQKPDIAKEKAERQMTMTILGSTFLVILFNSPININEAVAMYYPEYGILSREHYLYMALRNIFSVLSLMCDFLVVLSYLLLSAAFRGRFLRLFSPVIALCRGRQVTFTPESTLTFPPATEMTSTLTPQSKRIRDTHKLDGGGTF